LTARRPGLTLRSVVIGVLGPLQLGGKGPLSPRDRIVFEALVVHAGRSVVPDRLADALWGQDPPASWAKVVQGSIMRLRRVLGPGVIETTTDGYRLAVENA
jgi:DNA-binding SARP family transcriptional activator